MTSGSEGALIAPFFVSSRGYGVFLNTTFTHTITLAQNNVYSLNIDGEGYGGQMDYFFIAGPALTQVLDRYTQLTGRPRLPQKSLFGLLLSDKSDPDNAGRDLVEADDHRPPECGIRLRSPGQRQRLARVERGGLRAAELLVRVQEGPVSGSGRVQALV